MFRQSVEWVGEKIYRVGCIERRMYSEEGILRENKREGRPVLPERQAPSRPESFCLLKLTR